ncbi:hypothetical protein GCM10023074_09310 [Microbispora amethystogenes]|uniref:Uncharacterized protein n=1 Tax=Microbispora amethystogenes TaxID=1427754 RepID=A0ABQ4FI66_9ACTN|nr:hypothetical protein Mam01_46950 [Microbispora amethystogenes]
MNETISVSPSVPNPCSRAARAASVAYPCPQADLASRQPISTHGVKCAANLGTCNPVKPMNTPSASTAHQPNPRSSNTASTRSTSASLSSRVSVAGKCSMTTGSAFSAAKGSLSSSRQRRSTSLSVSMRFTPRE